MIEKFECKQCGKCCLEFEHLWVATPEDVERWEREGREDILQYVDIIRFENGILAEIWIDKYGEPMARCPFLKKVRKRRKYKCKIHETKPEACKDFPFYVYDPRNCDKCGLNFSSYFKEKKPDLTIKEFLQDINYCPKCNEFISKIHPWPRKYCPAFRSLGEEEGWLTLEKEVISRVIKKKYYFGFYRFS